MPTAPPTKRKRSAAYRSEALPDEWEPWVRRVFPSFVTYGFAEHHRMAWEWAWAIEAGRAPDPDALLAFLARGGAKSSTVEMIVAALGLRGRRHYVLYVSGTQERADDHVQNVAEMFETEEVDRYYPEHGRRRLGKFGNVKGWRRNRLWTAAGFIVDALGLDSAKRGIKLGKLRPDLIVFDDIDAKHDTKKTTAKKRETITTDVIPCGTPGVTAYIFIQNLITSTGIAAELAGRTADYLRRRLTIGPVPAIRGLKVERRAQPDGSVRTVIVGGEATWEGQSIAACQQVIDAAGFRSFTLECQHDVYDRPGALWTREAIEAGRVEKAPERFRRVVVAIDPSGGSDDIGIVAAGAAGRHGYTLADRTVRGAEGSLAWGVAAVRLWLELEADVIVGEKNFGGDMVETVVRVAAERVFREAAEAARTASAVLAAAGDVEGAKVKEKEARAWEEHPMPLVKLVTASRGKDVRAEPVQAVYDDGRAHHVGVFPELEAEMCSWVPGDPESPNRLDALVWAYTELNLAKGTTWLLS